MNVISMFFRVATLCSLLALPGTLAAQSTPDPEAQPPINPRAIEQAPQGLVRVLRKWENSSTLIKSLQGEHHRIVYDFVFETEKHADGKFFYESPDKGRIDIDVTEIPAGAVGNRVNPKTKKPFRVKSDIPEQWICDGTRIISINIDEKTAEIFQIPPQGRGVNIMNGPLPFLFGMPAEMALNRYKLKVLNENETTVMLLANPNWPRDRANWIEAKIILNKTIEVGGQTVYLPQAVQLTDPTRNSQTVYTFKNLKINAGEPIWKIRWRKWYEPNLNGLNVTTKNSGTQAVKLAADEVLVPSLIGMSHNDAHALLKKMQLEVKWVRGAKANRPQLVFHVYEQQPLAAKVVKKGSIVYARLFDKMEPQQVGSADKEAPR